MIPQIEPFFSGTSHPGFTPVNHRVTRILRRFASATGVLSVFPGAYLVLGWILSALQLSSLSEWNDVRVGSAACFLFTGVSIHALALRPECNLPRHALYGALASFAAVLLSSLVSQEAVSVLVAAGNDTHPGRNFASQGASLPISLSLLLLSSSILLRKFKSLQLAALALSGSTTLFASVLLIGRIFGIRILYSLSSYDAVSLQTGLFLFLQGTALSVINPSPHVTRTLASNFIGSFLLRRFYPVALLVLLFSAVARLAGQERGLYDTRFGLAIFLIANILILSLLVLVGVTLLNRIDRSRWITNSRLMESERHYRTLFEYALTGIAIGDPRGRITKSNSAFRDLFRLSEEECSRRSFSDFLLSREDHDEILTQLDEGKRIFNHESLLVRKDGSLFVALLNTKLLQEKKRSSILISIWDISPLKEAEIRLSESEKRYKSTLDSMLEGCQIIDFNWRYLYVNDAVVRHSHKSREELLNRTMPEVYPGIETTEMFATLKRCMEKRVSQTMKNRFVYPDGKIGWFSLLFDPVPEGSVIFSIDISDQVRAEENLRTLNSELERRIEERTLQLKRSEERYRIAKEEAESASRMKSEFLANMSHEIRTPLNAIIGMNYLMNKTELSDIQRDYAEKILGSSRHLLALINDILDFSKIEAGKLNLEYVPFNLEDVFETLSSNISHRAQEKNLELVIRIQQNVPRTLVGDPLRLGQILLNLSSNAIKFTEEGEVIIESAITGMEGNRVMLHFSVKDTGIGLRESQIESLFQAFTQADTSTTRKYGGTGLGLSICKRLVHLMGGEIGVESTPGKGSRFFFSIPYYVDEKNLPRENVIPPHLHPLRALVVDDNDSSRTVLQLYLNGLEMEATAVASGNEALEELRIAVRNGKKYDLILMDWLMPEMDGMSTTKIIRADESLFGKPKIIMVSALDRDVVIQKKDFAPLDGFLLKPVTPSSLYDAILSVFNSSRKEKKPSPPSSSKPEGFDRIRGARILLVEDDEINQDVAREILEGEGFLVTVIRNGLEALEQLEASKESEPFHAILMDLELPVMDGFTTTNEIRKSSRYGDIPIIALTTDEANHATERTLRQGMNLRIARQIDPKELFFALVKCIQPTKAMEESSKQSAFAEISDEESVRQDEMGDDKIKESSESAQLLVSDMIRLLQQNDTRSGERLERLQSELKTVELSDLYRRMEKRLNDFDYDGALALFKNLSNLIESAAPSRANPESVAFEKEEHSSP